MQLKVLLCACVFNENAAQTITEGQENQLYKSFWYPEIILVSYKCFSFVSLNNFSENENVFSLFCNNTKWWEMWRKTREGAKTLQVFRTWPFNPYFQHLALARLWCNKGWWLILVLSHCVVLISASRQQDTAPRKANELYRDVCFWKEKHAPLALSWRTAAQH